MTATTVRESGRESVKWNALALVGRQVVLLGSSVLLARILGPSAYGVIAQAGIYVALTTLILDQGLSAALITKAATTSRQLGAAAGLNLSLAAFLVLVTWLAAPAVGAFLGGPELPPVLLVLALGLFLKAAAIVPRVALMRSMNFRSMAIAEPSAAVLGALAGVVTAFLGFSYWSLVTQILVSDGALFVLLAVYSKAPLPNFRFGELKDTLGFSTRAFGDQLVSYFARNTDNIMVSRLFGAAQLSYYSLSYRVLLTPISMIGQVVTRVLFPAVARAREDRVAVHALITRSERAIAVIAFPLMLLVAAASTQLISVFLGSAWLPAAPVLTVLAITGARQAVTSINSPVLLAMNRPEVQLRFSITAAVVQIGGMAAGLPWGIFGVAVGYTVAGMALTPVIALVQKAVTGMSLRDQGRPLVAPLHAAVWAAALYWAVTLAPLPNVLTLLVGGVVAVAGFAVVFRVVHASAWGAAWRDARLVVGR